MSGFESAWKRSLRATQNASKVREEVAQAVRELDRIRRDCRPLLYAPIYPFDNHPSDLTTSGD